jgi:exodeoxyribonuclease-5
MCRKDFIVNNITVENLSNDQRNAYDSIMRWVSNPNLPLLSLGGYAGSGKSTLVSLVANEIELPAFCAFTGKATSVLRRKLRTAGTETVLAQRQRGMYGEPSNKPFCGTIHQLIYAACECLEPEVVEDVDENGKVTKKFIYPEKDENGNCVECGGKGWHRREALDRSYGLIIVDEASMVDDGMLADLRGYGVPILAVGDHGQLPPVSGTGSLMKNPNLRLEKIHRQAEGNPIIALSKMIREEGRLPEIFDGGDAVCFGQLRFVNELIEERYADASPERLLEMGLACYTNRRRVGLNDAVRRARGTVGGPFSAGEHVICLRNMKAEGGRQPIANGMRGVLQSDVKIKKNHKGEESETHIVGSIAFPEDEIKAHTYEMLYQQFRREKTFSSVEELSRETGLRSFSEAGALFDFGYAMTVHKMQGSQFDDLVVCAERGGYMDNEDWKRWLYTAVTRASKKLTVLR